MRYGIEIPDNYLHSSTFIRDWNRCKRYAYNAFFDAYWSRIYLLHSLHLKDATVAERARSTFEAIFREKIRSFDDLLEKTFQKAKALACPEENLEIYDTAGDFVHVEYVHKIGEMIEETFGPFEHNPTADEWRAMFNALEKRRTNIL